MKPILQGEAWYDFNDRFLKADDRSCVIMTVSYLDICLHNLLLQRAVHPNALLKLMSEARPLGTFSAKIDALRAFQWIDGNSYHDLHLIRKVRNHFAHNVDVHSFDDVPVRSWCEGLCNCDSLDSPREPECRLRYINSVCVTMCILESYEHGAPVQF
jgi:hypothetical protein